MADIKFTIKMIDSAADIQKKLSSAIADHLNDALKRAADHIEGQVQLLVHDRIYNSDTFRSLLDGELRGDMGLRNPQRVLNPILQVWMNSVVVTHLPVRFVGEKLTGGIRIEFIKSSWQDVLRMPEAEYISVNRRRKTRARIRWLYWLLLAGSQIIVRDWFVLFRDGFRYPPSRSEMAIMIQGAGKFWRVPFEHSGTKDNNFVTRALENIDEPIRRIIQREVYRVL